MPSARRLRRWLVTTVEAEGNRPDGPTPQIILTKSRGHNTESATSADFLGRTTEHAEGRVNLAELSSVALQENVDE